MPFTPNEIEKIVDSYGKPEVGDVADRAVMYLRAEHEMWISGPSVRKFWRQAGKKIKDRGGREPLGIEHRVNALRAYFEFGANATKASRESKTNAGKGYSTGYYLQTWDIYKLPKRERWFHKELSKDHLMETLTSSLQPEMLERVLQDLNK